MFKNILIFRIGSDWKKPSVPALNSVLEKFAFTPCGATQKVSSGWVTPSGVRHAPLVESVRGQWLFQLQVERKSVPPGVLKRELQNRVDKLQEETGRKIGRKEKKELKEEIELTLLPRAFSKTSTTMVWIDPTQRLLVIGAGSQKASDDVITKLIEAFADINHVLPIGLLQTQVSPTTAMASWLTTQEAPAGFTVDRDLELRQPDSEKSAVKYARHNLEIEEVKKHIEAGKLPMQVAMTWESGVSFMLGADMAIRKIEMLDAVLEAYAESEGGFEGDALIVTTELAKLIPDLVGALGGELDVTA